MIRKNPNKSILRQMTCVVAEIKFVQFCNKFSYYERRHLHISYNTYDRSQESHQIVRVIAGRFYEEYSEVYAIIQSAKISFSLARTYSSTFRLAVSTGSFGIVLLSVPKRTAQLGKLTKIHKSFVELFAFLRAIAANLVLQSRHIKSKGSVEVLNSCGPPVCGKVGDQAPFTQLNLALHFYFGQRKHTFGFAQLSIRGYLAKDCKPSLSLLFPGIWYVQ